MTQCKICHREIAPNTERVITSDITLLPDPEEIGGVAEDRSFHTTTCGTNACITVVHAQDAITIHYQHCPSQDDMNDEPCPECARLHDVLRRAKARVQAT
jgi:hypothetical protein